MLGVEDQVGMVIDPARPKVEPLPAARKARIDAQRLEHVHEAAHIRLDELARPSGRRGVGGSGCGAHDVAEHEARNLVDLAVLAPTLGKTRAGSCSRPASRSMPSSA
jgi:hypothetical protein